jgi:hypothetical protein
VVAVGRVGPEPGMVGRSPDAFVQARRAERMAERRGGLGGGFCPLCLVHGMRGARGSKGQWHGGQQHAGTVPAHWRAHRLEQVERLDDAATWRDTGGWIRARAMEEAGGDWSLWRLWRDAVGRMRACVEEQSGTEHQRRGVEEGGAWQTAARQVAWCGAVSFLMSEQTGETSQRQRTTQRR